MSSVSVARVSWLALTCTIALSLCSITSSGRAQEPALGNALPGAVPSPREVARRELELLHSRELAVRAAPMPCQACGIVAISVGTPLAVVLATFGGLWLQDARAGYDPPSSGRKMAAIMFTGAAVGLAYAAWGAWQVPRARRARRAKADALAEIFTQRTQLGPMLMQPSKP